MTVKILFIIGLLTCILLAVPKMRALKNDDRQKIESALTAIKSRPVILEDKDSSVSIGMGNSLQYSHSVYGSVGSGYRVEYDKQAFSMDYTAEYDDPEAVAAGMCGGDSAVQTCIFKPLKRGKYTIRIIHEFRGTVERTVTYKITVK